MKHLFALLFAATAFTSVASANVYVPYDRWVALDHCGGYTRLICDGPRRDNQCRIEFRDSYGCPSINLYTGYSFYPTSDTAELPMAGSFYVDNNKISWGLSFRVFLHNSNNSRYEKITYQFNY